MGFNNLKNIVKGSALGKKSNLIKEIENSKEFVASVADKWANHIVAEAIDKEAKRVADLQVKTEAFDKAPKVGVVSLESNGKPKTYEVRAMKAKDGSTYNAIKTCGYKVKSLAGYLANAKVGATKVVRSWEKKA